MAWRNLSHVVRRGMQSFHELCVAFFITRYEGEPAGCGGLKLFGTGYGEVKRMYVRPAYRGLEVFRVIAAGFCRNSLAILVAPPNHVGLLFLF